MTINDLRKTVEPLELNVPHPAMIADIRVIREYSGVSLRQAAQAAGVSPATLSRVENGHLPDLITALKLARFYVMQVEEMWRIPE